MCGPVAQLDRANGYEPLGREFESLRAHHRFSTVELKLASRDLGAYAAMNGRSSTVVRASVVAILRRLFLAI
jgi:hypothetical protein